MKDFSEILDSPPNSNPNITYNKLSDIITSNIHEHFPLIKKYSKNIMTKNKHG